MDAPRAQAADSSVRREEAPADGSRAPAWRPGPRTARELSEIAGEVYAGGSWAWRWMMRARPRICPFERVLAWVDPGEIRAGGGVLDVGCGAGLMLVLLARTAGVRRGVGFDSSGTGIAQAKAAAARVAATTPGVSLEFFRLDATDPWPEAPGQGWDVVFLIDVMHHVPRGARRDLLERSARAVRPGGRLIYKDMAVRPRWRAAMNQLHDLVLAREWITHEPIENVEAWASGEGLRVMHGERAHRWWYAHELRVFEKRAE